MLLQSPQGPADRALTLAGIKEAPTLFDACAQLGIKCKTVGDVNLMRNDPAPLKPFVHQFDGPWLLPLIPNFRCLYIHGASGVGKTQWALAHGENPLLVRSLDQFKLFNPDSHDLIVVDDMDLASLDRSMVIAMIDWDEDSTIKCRYRDAILPRHTRLIFTSNNTFDQSFPSDYAAGAINRRFSRIIHCNGPTYHVNPLPIVAPAAEELNIDDFLNFLDDEL